MPIREVVSGDTYGKTREEMVELARQQVGSYFGDAEYKIILKNVRADSDFLHRSAETHITQTRFEADFYAKAVS